VSAVIFSEGAYCFAGEDVSEFEGVAGSDGETDVVEFAVDVTVVIVKEDGTVSEAGLVAEVIFQEIDVSVGEHFRVFEFVIEAAGIVGASLRLRAGVHTEFQAL